MIVKTISEIKKTAIKKDFIVDNLMKSNGLYCLVERPKVGKSLLALQLADSIANGTTFLGFNTNPSPVLYISTEMTSAQLLERINKMNLHLNDDNFFVEEQEVNQRKLNLTDLKLTFKEFSENIKGKFVIVDMFCGVDTYTDSDLSNYQDMGQKVIPKYREICKEYGLTILLIHHLNKSNTTLGSTAIDRSVDGIITLKLDNNLKDKIYFQYESRDYEGRELILKRNDNLIFEISEFESNDLNPNILIFLNYAIKKQDFTFTCGSITSDLTLSITPSTFGKLLRKNLNNLEKEGLHIEDCRIGKERKYRAYYEEPPLEDLE